YLKRFPAIFWQGKWRFPAGQKAGDVSNLGDLAEVVTEEVWQNLQHQVHGKFFQYLDVLIDGFYEGLINPGEDPPLESAIREALAHWTNAVGEHDVKQWPDGNEPMTVIPPEKDPAPDANPIVEAAIEWLGGNTGLLKTAVKLI